MKIILANLPLPLAIGESAAFMGTTVKRVGLLTFDVAGVTGSSDVIAELRSLADLDYFSQSQS